ncbi:MAG: hypothetical protein IPK82_09600 [Polyangiaceae bacterium]|nr:hypothetical protein [Polyangiaceae bacterium]
MRLHILLAFTCLSALACAKGNTFQGTGGNGTGGSGDTGGGGQTTGSTTTIISTGGSTTSSTLPPCDEQPCKLVSPQCGCADGEMCAIGDTGDRECHAEGDKQIDQECVGLFSCAAGSLCVQVSTQKSVCSPYCDNDNQCNGGICLIQLNDPSSPGQALQDVTLCSDDCDPTTAAGCPPGLNLGCQLGQESTGQMRVFTICGGTGPGGQAATCTDSEDCAAGYGCFTLSDMSQKCLKYCKPASPSCPGAATCYSFDPQLLYKGVEFGACL